MISPRFKRELPRFLGPIAVAIFPVLSVYSTNLDWIVLSQLLLPLTLLSAAVLILVFLLRVIYKNADKASFLSVCFVALIWSYGLLLPDAVSMHKAWTPPDSWVRVLVYQGMVGLFGVLAIITFRSQKTFSTASRVATILSVSILCVPMLQIAWYRSRNLLAERSEKPGNKQQSQNGPAGAGFTPDIYHIILDAYSRDDVLAKIYGVDNTPFLNALRSRGFKIMPESRSNYMQTMLSLTSLLNMTYLDQFPGPTDSAFLYNEHLARHFKNSAVVDELQLRGYSYVRLFSEVEFFNGGEGTELRPPRVMIDASQIDLYDRLIRLTPLRILPLDSWFAAPSQPLVLFQLRTLQHPMPVAHGPLFVFAHILSPHPPFIFDRNGNPPPGRLSKSVSDGSDFPGTVEEYKRGYSEQVQFVNQQILKAVDSILSRYPADRRPIIVIQGDHGGGLGYHQEKLEKTLLWARASILNAYLLPPTVHFDLYDTITPVNTYRMILNGLFATQFKRLPDRTYYAPFSRPFEQTLIPEEKLAVPEQ